MSSLLRVFLTLLLMVGATSSHASVYYTVWYNSTTFYGGTPPEACQQIVGLNNIVSYTGYLSNYSNCQFTTTTGTTSVSYGNNVGTCPSGFADDGSGTCVAVPVCLDSQIETTPGVCINKCDILDINGNPRVASFSFIMGQSPATAIDDVLGCNYSRQSVDTCTLSQEGIATCYYTYSETGEYFGVPAATDSTFVDPIPEQSNADNTGSTNTDSTVVSPPVTNPDSSVTDVTVQNKTTTSGSGAKMWADSSNIYMQDSTGTINQYDKVTTTITNPDGSKSEVISITSGNVTPAITSTVLDKSTATVTSSNISSTTISGGSTTTNNYNSSGTLTDSTVVASGTGSGSGQDDQTVEGNCGAPNQPACDVTLTGEEHLTDPADVLTESGVLTQRDDNIADLQSGAGEDTGTLFNITNGFETSFTSVLGSGTCDGTYGTVDYMGHSFAPFVSFCPVWDSDGRPLMKWFFYMLTLISLYFIYLRAMRSN